jgi:DNA-binding transcriptional MerR regulator
MDEEKHAMRNLPRQTTILAQGQQQPLLKIGDVAKLSGIGIEALRFYEKSGLLDRPARALSGYRVYGPEALQRLAFIKQAQALGFSLDEIRRILDDARSGRSPCAEVREMMRRRLAEVDERIRELRRFRKAMTGTLAEWDRIGHAPGQICGLIEGTQLEAGAKLNRKRAERLAPRATGGRRGMKA